MDRVDFRNCLETAIRYKAPVDYIRFLLRESPSLIGCAFYNASNNLDLVWDLFKTCCITAQDHKSAINYISDDFAKRFVLNALENNEKIFFSDSLLQKIRPRGLRFWDSLKLTQTQWKQIARLCAKEDYDLFFDHVTGRKGRFCNLQDELKQELKAGFLTRWEKEPRASAEITRKILFYADGNEWNSCNIMFRLLKDSKFINALEKGSDGETSIDCVVNRLKVLERWKVKNQQLEFGYYFLSFLLATTTELEFDASTLDKNIKDGIAKRFPALIPS